MLGKSAREHRLARAGQSADQQETGPLARLGELADRELHVRARELQRLLARGQRHVGAEGLQRAHLGAHRRTVGEVERHEGAPVAVVARGEVGLEQRAGRVPRAVRLQIHGEERDVADRIGVAVALGELDAVDRDELVPGQHVDVLQPQVAVRLARNAAGGARLDQRAAALELGLERDREPQELDLGRDDARLLLEVGQVVAAVRAHALEARPARDLGPAARLSVEARDAPAERGEQRGIQRALPDEVRQRRLFGKAPHVHRVLDRLAASAEHDAPFFERDRHDAEVDARREAAVELDLGRAHRAALLERGVVEEAQVDRLLELVDVLAREDHGRGVRVHDLDRRRGMREGLRAGERGEDCGEVGSGHAAGALLYPWSCGERGPLSRNPYDC